MVRIETHTVEETIAELESRIREKESEYQMPSATMLNNLREGTWSDTWDIALWMQDYHVLNRLRDKV